jgi:hypothetical protein
MTYLPTARFLAASLAAFAAAKLPTFLSTARLLASGYTVATLKWGGGDLALFSPDGENIGNVVDNHIRIKWTIEFTRAGAAAHPQLQVFGSELNHNQIQKMYQQELRVVPLIEEPLFPLLPSESGDGFNYLPCDCGCGSAARTYGTLSEVREFRARLITALQTSED